MALVSVAAKKKAAAPSWADLSSAFGEQGIVRNARGKIKGYRYPKTGDAEKDGRTAAKAYELWEPHRRVSIAAGAERNASVRTSVLEHRATGQRRVVDARFAEREARKHGMVEYVNPGRRQGDFSPGHVMYRNGSFQRYLGNNQWQEVE